MINPASKKMLCELVREAVEAVPATERFQAEEILARYPHLKEDRSAMLDLAYEEYCQAVERGDTIDPHAFAAQFPAIEESLLELFEVHSFVVGHSLLSGVESDIHWPTAGEVFLGFELLEEIGKGAFSRVFLAREVGLGRRQVVVKVSRKGADEATMLGLLDHPNIVPVHSITTDEAVELSALCMPYLGRTTAAEWIQTRFKSSSVPRLKTPRHLQSVIEIGKGVCQGLQFAHHRHVLHCDIKPSNILITHDGEPLLLDFNLSTNRSEERHLVGGTLLYMAPEQLHRARGDRTVQITGRTDIFCLGATLYQMATGQLPFPMDASAGSRLKDVIGSALEGRREFAGKSHPLPAPLFSVLRDALAFDPEHRIASANEFYHRLAACQKKLARPRLRWLVPVACSGVLAGVIASAYIWGNEPAPAAPIPPPQSIAKEESEPPEKSQEPQAVASPFHDRLEKARKAEAEARYPDAIALYREILDRDREHPEFTEQTHRSVTHSLAFCLVMAGEYIEANHLFAALHSDNLMDEAFILNESACLVLLAFDAGPAQNKQLLRRARMSVSNAIAVSGNQAEQHHIVALLDAFLAPPIEGHSRAVAVRKALHRMKTALEMGLPPRKALAIGHLFPEAKDMSPLAELLEDNPELTADLEVNLSLRSPVTGKESSRTFQLP